MTPTIMQCKRDLLIAIERLDPKQLLEFAKDAFEEDLSRLPDDELRSLHALMFAEEKK